MAIVVPTLPTDTSQNKRLRTSSRERVDAVDFKNIGGLLSERVADFFRSVVSDEASYVIRGFRTTQDTGSNMQVKVQPESGQNYSALLQAGFLCKEVAASVLLPIDSEATLTNRIDIVSVRYVEDETTPAIRPILSNPTITFVDDEAPGSGTGDGTTALYDLANAGAIGATLVARVGGIPVNAVIVPATGASGKDQIAFAQAPTSGATIRLDYYYLTGGVEQAVSTNTRFTSIVEYVVTKGVANGVEPGTPAGYVKVARISGITTSTTAITNAMITKTRIFLYGAEQPTVFDTAGGSIQSFIEDFGFMRNGFFPTIDMLAAKTLSVRRTANATDLQPLATWARPGSTDPVTTIDRRGHLHQNYKFFREDWETLSIGATEVSRWTLAGVGTPAATRPAIPNGAVQLTTTAGGSDFSALTSKMFFDYAAVTGLLATHASENLVSMKWVMAPLSLATVQYTFGLGAAGVVSVGFQYSSAGLGAVPAANWATSIVTTGPTNNYGDTGVAAVAAEWRLFEVVQRAAGTWDFYINAALVGTVSLTPMVQVNAPTMGVGNLTTAARSMYSKLVSVNTGRLFTD